MSILEARDARSRVRPAEVERSPRVRHDRDLSIDVARAWCLLVVVVLHASMAGIGVVRGGLVVGNALEGWDGFASASWFVQVMPLFFVLGGASGYLHWTRVERDGGGRRAFVADRVRRLLVPAVGAAAAVVVLLVVLSIVGVDGSLVAEAGFRASQPLWFLGVYLLCSCAVPLAVAAHRARPATTFAVLVGAVALVEVLRVVGAPPIVAVANLLFVWLLVQQLGFLLADGTIDRVPRDVLLPGAVVAVAVALAMCSWGVGSFDLIAALNPPSAVLVVVGIAQLLVFAALRPTLRRLARRRGIGRVVRAVNERAMTIYAWHMLALLGLAGLLATSGLPLPDPLGSEWWATRPLWLLASLVAVATVVAFAGGIELRRGPSSRSAVRGGRLRVATAVTVASVGTLGVLVSGGAILGWLIALAGWSAAIASLRSGSGREAAAPSRAER